MPNRPLFVALCSVAAVACSSADPLGPGFEDDFVLYGGCADVVFFAVDGPDEVLVTFQAPGLVASARASALLETSVFDLPATGVTAIIEQGSKISDAICDDVIENGGPRVDRTWTAVSGRATVTIRPGPNDFGSQGDLSLDDVVFVSDDGRRVRLPELRWTDIGVGWLPG
jgi:hypothetical protein